ncbi:MAG: hypothetical protein KBF21_06345 [Thermoanaerobaculia bacterium]|nr:hypothetical protein [Thermoanaerobaculia bacterium]MBP9823825.1 hypothetical protein [Thermoanaerobaculia bacterium]
MSPAAPERRPRRVALLLLACGFAGLAGMQGTPPLPAQTVGGMQDTKHNLSVTGPGPITAQGETRICIFCHTPHNAAPDSPLWNREIEPQAYTVYASPTLGAGVLPQPSGPTKLCLTCHDGTVAMGAVLNPPGGIAMSGSDNLPPGSLSDFGLDLSGHHPVSFSYSASLPNLELQPLPPDELTFGNGDELHCSTCHDPHNDEFGRFLVKDNRGSALCITCHQMTDWASSAHATSSESVGSILPRPPRSWPDYDELRDWGCESCHTPHFAATAEQLLIFSDAPPAPFSCTSCHSADPTDPPHLAGAPAGVAGAGRRAGMGGMAVGAGAGRADIAGQVGKFSAHPESARLPSGLPRGRGVGARTDLTSVGCADCHNPHMANDQQAELPYVSGATRGVPGVDRNGAEVATATYEYEICFRCHGDNTPDAEYIPRVVGSTNTRLDFDAGNPSFHPVVEMGRGTDVPSIPSALEPRLTPSDQIGCTSCHADDEGGSRGPHGSDFAPILKERYETIDGTGESYESYALCYRCHERTSILADESFRTRAFRTTPSGGGHSGHLAAGAPCSACHDPHGVAVGGNEAFNPSGDHTHLINFDTQIVAPVEGANFPAFKDTGSRSGTCTLTCHGVNHLQTAYP